MIFPEGTRIRKPGLGNPKRGVGRLALQTGVPVVPIAVHGTENARRKFIIRPTKIRVRAGRPVTFPLVDDPSAHLAGEVTARIWPCVELQYNWLLGEQMLPERVMASVVGIVRGPVEADEAERAAAAR
jgi:1-acyl-sn-glycerol-3-phosphate acyltransferase